MFFKVLSKSLLMGSIPTSNDLDDDIAILCAVVKGVSELDAENSVLKDWPEAIEFEIGETSNLQMGDRYPLNDWMVNRGLIQLGKGNVNEITR